MLIGIDCFKDTEIHSIIASQSKFGNCEITGQVDVMVYDTEKDTYLEDYLSEILDVYTPKIDLPDDFPNEYLDSLANILFRDWEIFNVEINDINKIIIEVCKNIYPREAPVFNEKVGIEKLCDSSFLKRKCLVKESSWERFMSSIKNINRFHSNHINLELLEELFKSESMKLTFEKGELTLFRGRISDENGYNKIHMGPPPAKSATAGRVNSAGISCLYLASDVKTTFHEIRARDFDYISVGKFVSDKDVKIVNLSNLNKISPFSTEGFDSEWFAINMNILKKISNEIAKPLRRQDSELDYLPAQYISDFVKSLGFDGICYRSTLNVEGLNYAFFDPKKFKCEEVMLYHIKSMNFEAEPCVV